MITAMKSTDGRTVYIERNNVASWEELPEGTVKVTMKSGIVYLCHSAERWRKMEMETR